MKISEILRSKGTTVITITQDQTLKQVIRLLDAHNIGALVVVDERGAILGIITERDIIRYAAKEDPDFTLHVSQIMTRQVVVGIPQDDINSVALTMTEKHFRHLPVVEKGGLVGILSLGDIVKAQRDRYEGEVHTLQIQVSAAEETG
jgi:CBS domain-containing protein